MKQMNVDNWLTKQEVCARLACSERTIERLAKEGRLKKKLRHISGRKSLAVYSPESVADLQEQNLRSVPVGPGGMALATIRSRALPIVPMKPEEDRAVDVPSLPAAPNAFLTISQAAHYLGTTKAFIKRAIAAGTLPATKDRCTRIRKTDVEKL